MSVAALLWIYEHVTLGGRRRALGIGTHDAYRAFDADYLKQIGFHDTISSVSLESEPNRATEAYFFEDDTERFSGRWMCRSTSALPRPRPNVVNDFHRASWSLNDRTSGILLVDRADASRQRRRLLDDDLASFARLAFFAPQTTDIGDGVLIVHDPEADWFGFPHSAPAGMAATSTYARIRIPLNVRVNTWSVLPDTHYSGSLSIYIGITLQGATPQLTIVGTRVEVSFGMWAKDLRKFLREQVAKRLHAARLRLIDISPKIIGAAPTGRRIAGAFFLPGDRVAQDYYADGHVDAGGVTLVTNWSTGSGS